MTRLQELKNVETQVRELLEELELKESVESTVNAQLRELSNFYRISESLAAGGDANEILEQICDSVAGAPDVDGVWIGLVGEDGEKVVPIVSRKVPQSLLKPVSITEPGSPISETMGRGKPTIVDSRGMPRRFDRWCAQAQDSGFTSSVVLPLVYGDSIIGSMVLYSRRSDLFSAESLPLFTTYANQTSSAVRTAQQEESLKHLEKKASFHEQEYRLFLERLTDGVFMLDPGLDCTYCNRTFERIAGKDMDKIVGKQVVPMFRKHDAGTIRSTLARCLEGAGSSCETRNAEGGMALSLEVHPMRAPDGSVAGILGIAKDITGQEKLRDAEKRIARLAGQLVEKDGILENSPTGYISINPDGKIGVLNPAAAGLLGRGLSACKNKSVYLFFSKRGRPSLEAAVASALHQGTSEVEAPVEIDGVEKYRAMRLSRRLQDDEYHVIIYIRDAEEHRNVRENYGKTLERHRIQGRELEKTLVRARKAEGELDKLRRKEKQLSGKVVELKAALLTTEKARNEAHEDIESSPTGFVKMRPDGEIISMNPAAAGLLGTDISSCKGQPVYIHFSMAGRSALEAAVANALHQGTSEVEAPVEIDGVEKYRTLRLSRQHHEGNDDYLVTMHIYDTHDHRSVREEYEKARERHLARGRELEKTLGRLKKAEYELGVFKKRSRKFTAEAKELMDALAATEKERDDRRKELAEANDTLDKIRNELDANAHEANDLRWRLAALDESLVQSGEALVLAEAGTGSLVSMNKPAMHLFDYSEGELHGRSIRDLFTPENGSGGAIEKVMNGTHTAFESRHLVTKGGATFAGTLTSVPFQRGATRLIAVLIHDCSAEHKTRRQFDYAFSLVQAVEEMLRDEHYYTNVEEHLTELVQTFSPRFDTLGFQSVSITLEGRTYAIEEKDSPRGKTYSSDLILSEIPKGGITVTMSASRLDEHEDGFFDDVARKCVNLLASSIGWTIERTRLRGKLARNSEQLMTLKKILKRQNEMNDPLQALQSSSDLLLDKSAALDTTDRSRLNIIGDQAKEVRKIVKRIATLAESVR